MATQRSEDDDIDEEMERAFGSVQKTRKRAAKASQLLLSQSQRVEDLDLECGASQAVPEEVQQQESSSDDEDEPVTVRKRGTKQPVVRNAPINIQHNETHKTRVMNNLKHIEGKRLQRLLNEVRERNNKKDNDMVFDHCKLLDDLETFVHLDDLNTVAEVISVSATLYTHRVERCLHETYFTHHTLVPAEQGGAVSGGGGDTQDDKGKSVKTKKERNAEKDAAAKAENMHRMFEEVKTDAELRVEQGRDEDSSAEVDEEDDAEDTFIAKDDQQLPKTSSSFKFDTDSIKYSDHLYRDVIVKENERRRKIMGTQRARTKFMMDDDSKFKLVSCSIVDNEYYQIATSRFKEQTSKGLLLLNAKMTGSGRQVLLHNRQVKWDDKEGRDVVHPTQPFVTSASGLLENCLSMRPKELPNCLFSDEDTADMSAFNAEYEKKLLQQAREVLGEDVEGEEGVEMVEEGEKKDDEEEEENDEQMEDDLLERPKTQYKHSMKRHTDNKNTIYIKDVQSEDAIAGVTCHSGNIASLREILSGKMALSKQDLSWKKGAQAEELQADMCEVVLDTAAMTSNGIDEDLASLDEAWNAVLVKRTFTHKDLTAALKSNPSIGKSHRVIPPGTYRFFAESEVRVVNYPADVMGHSAVLDDAGSQAMARPVGEEGTQRDPIHIDEAVEDGIGAAPLRVDFTSDHDFGGGMDYEDDLPLDGPSKRPEEANTNLEDRFDDANTAAIDRIVVIEQDLQSTEPSEAVRAVGKADDSHWKLAPSHPDNTKEKEKKERKKTQKEIKQEDDNELIKSYFCVNTKANVMPRFTLVNSHKELLREESELRLPEMRECDRLVAQEKYDYNLFFRPFFLPDEKIGRLKVDEKKRKETDEEERENIDSRPAAYNRMMGMDDPDMDTFVGFLHTFEDYGTVEAVHQQSLNRSRLEQQYDSVEDHDNVGMSEGIMMDDDDGSGGGGGFEDDYVPGGVEDASMRDDDGAGLPNATTFNYNPGMFDDDEGEDDDDGAEGNAAGLPASVVVNNKRFALRQIKLDTKAMKSALSDVLTNPIIVPERLHDTLMYVNRAMDTQDMQPNIEATVCEIPDVLEVTRALFAPPTMMNVETDDEDDTMTAPKEVVGGKRKGKASGTFLAAQQKKAAEHKIQLDGRHTLQSTFTALPARVAQRHTNEVTVASTIAMMLHLANENNLVLRQKEAPDEKMGKVGGKKGRGGAEAVQRRGDASLDRSWMADFEVVCDGAVETDEDDDEDVVGLRRQTAGREGPAAASSSNDVLEALTSSQDEEAQRKKKYEEVARQQKARQQEREADAISTEMESLTTLTPPAVTTSSKKRGHEQVTPVMDQLPGTPTSRRARLERKVVLPAPVPFAEDTIMLSDDSASRESDVDVADNDDDDIEITHEVLSPPKDASSSSTSPQRKRTRQPVVSSQTDVRDDDIIDLED